MRRRWVQAVLGIVSLCWMGYLSPLGADQVVAPDIQAWARDALAAEKKLGVPAPAAGTNTVAVLYFQNDTGNVDLDPLQKGLALMLITDLSKIDSLHVVERVRLQALTRELDLAATPLVDSQTAPRMGKLLGARWMVGGGRLGHNRKPLLDIDCYLLDLPRDTLLGQVATQGPLAEIFNLEKKILHEIVQLLNIALTPDQMRTLDEHPTTNLRALLLLFKGVDAGDRGRYADAARHYTQALQEDPGLGEAQDYLNELKELGLLRRDAATGINLLHSLRERTSLNDGLTSESTIKRLRTPRDILRQPLLPEPLLPEPLLPAPPPPPPATP